MVQVFELGEGREIKFPGAGTMMGRRPLLADEAQVIAQDREQAMDSPCARLDFGG
jgi:hypothetical protein